MNQEVNQQRFLRYLWLLQTPKKLIKVIYQGQGLDTGTVPDPRIRPKKSGSGSATLVQPKLVAISVAIDAASKQLKSWTPFRIAVQIM
jgi:hypothetical protein